MDDNVMEAFLIDVDADPQASAGCTSTSTQPHPRFAEPLSDTAVEIARKGAVPKTTQRDTLWCTSVLGDWITERNKRSEEQVPTDLCEQSSNTGFVALSWK